jgi:hypothetical protein
MKKRVILICIFFGIGPIYAQTGNDKWFNTVPSLGANYTSTIEDFTNFMGGVSLGVDARIGKSLFFQPGLQYNYFAFNATVDTAQRAINRTGAVKGHYLSVPLIIGYKITEKDVFNWRVHAGFNTSLFISGSVDADNFKEDFERSINSIRAGTGIDILNFTLDLNADIGINQGITLPENVTTFRITATLGYLLKS